MPAPRLGVARTDSFAFGEGGLMNRANETNESTNRRTAPSGMSRTTLLVIRHAVTGNDLAQPEPDPPRGQLVPVESELLQRPPPVPTAGVRVVQHQEVLDLLDLGVAEAV